MSDPFLDGIMADDRETLFPAIKRDEDNRKKATEVVDTYLNKSIRTQLADIKEHFVILAEEAMKECGLDEGDLFLKAAIMRELFDKSMRG